MNETYNDYTNNDEAHSSVDCGGGTYGGGNVV
jgi:hypothetical protein